MSREKTSRIWTINKIDLQNLLDSSATIKEILKKLSFNATTGRSHRSLQKRIFEDNLNLTMFLKNNISHKKLLSQRLNKASKIPNKDIFKASSDYTSNKDIKKRLLNDFKQNTFA